MENLWNVAETQLQAFRLQTLQAPELPLPMRLMQNRKDEMPAYFHVWDSETLAQRPSTFQRVLGWAA